MASARMSLGSIFGAVSQTAGTITSTLETVNHAVGMANEAISNMAIQQKVRSKLDNETFQTTVLIEKSKELAETTLEGAKFRDQSEAHAQAYDSAFNQLAAILNKK